MRWAVTAALLVLGSACDGGGCVDPDRDGYGPGCELGEDCDPDNADRNVDCVSVPPPDCAADPRATGCPCLPNSVGACLSELDGVGICAAGQAVCVSRHWGVCEGGVGPAFEYCDGVDQDCDGRVDEGVVSPCGGCTPGCVGDAWGEDPIPFEPGEGLALTRFGELTLATVERTYGAVWVANSAESTLSRIDADAAVETARYPSGGGEPSRVAVDFLGDAWIVNREFDGVPSVTKVAASADRCVDGDGDGLETSTGPSDVRPIAEDECVLFHVPVGEEGAVARAIAIDGDTGLDGISGGDAWIGLHDAEAVVELDGLTGAMLRRIETPGFSPYAATFDRWGTLWMIERDGVLARIDPRTEEVELIEAPLACFLLYGLAADLEGRLLMTGFSCDQVLAYDPALERWQTRDAPPSPRAAAVDGSGDFWIAHTAARVSRVQLDPLAVRETFTVSDEEVSPLETVGVAVDAFDQVWTVSSRSAAGPEGVASRVDPEGGAITAQVTVGASPHVQGDLTGSRVRFGLVERASTTRAFEGCGADLETRWLRVHFAGDPGVNGRVTVEMRHAEDAPSLEAAPWTTLGVAPDSVGPWDLDGAPDGGVVELRLTLEVDGRAGAPRIRRVGVEWQCPGPD